ncbi:MAG: N-glycosylase/DNA lyase [Candidatus Diapherotrites archaeon]|nr:N-glycosylase/DNA lyase [Candidatus Diapherotrites archaeon]
MRELRESYAKLCGIIKERLSEFKANWLDEKAVFAELIFCLLTPQSKAVSCYEAVRELFAIGIENWNMHSVENVLKGKTRFHRRKARNILQAKELFVCKNKLKIKEILQKQHINEDRLKTREWLVRNVRGLGLKEASHFLRNIGFYENIAIIDRHILKNMEKYGIISKVPKAITKKRYYELEHKLREFGMRIGIPMHEIDMLFWASETGFVFK